MVIIDVIDIITVIVINIVIVMYPCVYFETFSVHTTLPPFIIVSLKKTRLFSPNQFEAKF